MRAVRLLAPLPSPNGAYQPGSVVHLSGDEADQLVASGLAETVAPAAPEEAGASAAAPTRSSNRRAARSRRR